ncbi:MAG: tRNA (mnm(5)s(2)U34)-methyltransferase [Chitinophagales bacterium]
MPRGLLINAVELSHRILSQVVTLTDTVIDATCGNGNDTLFLAGLAKNGKVYAFDIALEAIVNTNELIKNHGLQDRVQVIQSDYREISLKVSDQAMAIMFNLGYLPGAPRDTATRLPESLEAVKNSIPLLKEGGVMTIVCYTGHNGGKEEAEAIESYLGTLRQQEFEVTQIRFINQINNPPVLLVVNRLRGMV